MTNYFNLTYFRPPSSVSLVHFEQVNVCLVDDLILLQLRLLRLSI